MGKTIALNRRTLDWARARFSDYYRSTPVAAPARCARREFAWFPFSTETLMRRHLAVGSPTEMTAFLADAAPRHVYYSAAYYREPAHPKMDAKGWLGADLIFDLDADHLRGAEALDFAGQLALVKTRLRLLLDEFLLGDFGIDPRDVRVSFSGGRGYHVHVTDERFLTLNSPERRELIDYVQGTGFDPRSAIVEQAPAVAAGGEAGDDDPPRRRRGHAKHFQYLAPTNAPGWQGRTSRSLLVLLGRWEQAGPDAAAREMVGWGVSPRKAKSLAHVLIDDGLASRIRARGSLDVFPGDVPEPLLEGGVRQAAIDLAGETDAPVTTDIHRLIRLPESLHGGTGFRVVPLRPEEVEAFEPLGEARLPDPPGESVRVELLDSIRYPFDPPIAGRLGESLDVAASVALFLILRGEAALPPSPIP